MDDQLIFTEDDLLGNHGTLDALLIRIFIDFGITLESFAKKHREYMIENNQLAAQKITSNKNNLLKPLNRIKSRRRTNGNDYSYSGDKRGSIITVRTFELIVMKILKLNITQLQMTVKNIDNQKFTATVDRLTF